MPLPTDETLLSLAQNLLNEFDTIFGLHPGFRPAHAKGIMLTGIFTSTPKAKSLSKAPHFVNSSTPVTVRFSDSTGIPLVPDNDPNANPRGMAIRFYLGERVHTDIVSHSTEWFSHAHGRRIPGTFSRSRSFSRCERPPDTDRNLPRLSSRRTGLRPDSEACAFQLC